MKKSLLGLILLETVVMASAATTGWILPTQNGTYSTWKPSTTGAQNYTMVDESTCNGNVDYVTTSTTGAKESYSVSLDAVPNGSIIKAVYIAPCALQNVVTPSASTISMFYRLNNVDSNWAGTYMLRGTSTPSAYSYAYIATPQTVKSTSTKLEIGAVLTATGGVGGGARLSRLAVVVSYSQPVVIPNSPSNLVASLNESGKVALSWNDNATNENGSILERSVNGGTFSTYAYLSANATSYTDTQTTNATYTYRVRAYSSTSYSGYSNTATLTISPPSAPSNVSVSVTTSSTSHIITVNWVDTSSNETAFYVEKSTDGIYFSTVGTVDVNVVTFSEVTQNSGMYYYRVRSYNASGYSAYSNVSTVTVVQLPVVPEAPSDLGGFVITGSSTQVIYWQDNSSNELGFMVERSLDDVVFEVYASTTENAPYIVETMLSTEPYYYRVRAFNQYGYSSYSNSAQLVLQ